MTASGRGIARTVIDAGAVTVDPANGFTWSSGLWAPLYCDHRRLIGLPDRRDGVCAALAELVRRCHPAAAGLAAVAVAAVPWAAWVADRLRLPLVVVRPNAKGHGLRHQVEGLAGRISPVVVVEDVVSTGGSVLRTAAALRAEGVTVSGAVTILDYGISRQALPDASLRLHSLYAYPDLRAELGTRLRPGALDPVDAWYAQVAGPREAAG